MNKENNRVKNEYSQQFGVRNGFSNSNISQISKNNEFESDSVRLDQFEGKSN